MTTLGTGKTNTLQTLDRGLLALRLLAAESAGLTIAQIASALNIHRAIAYRLISTLEQHALIARTRDGRIVTGAGVLRLSATFEAQFRTLSQPYLQQLAQDAAATAFITMAHGDICTVIQACEPQTVDLRMSYRVGSRHAVQVGAAGIAILAARSANKADSQAVQQARKLGYSLTRGELQKGAIGIASAIQASKAAMALPFEASVGVVAMEDLNLQHCAHLVQSCAQQLAAALTPV